MRQRQGVRARERERGRERQFANLSTIRCSWWAIAHVACFKTNKKRFFSLYTFVCFGGFVLFWGCGKSDFNYILRHGATSMDQNARNNLIVTYIYRCAQAWQTSTFTWSVLCKACLYTFKHAFSPGVCFDCLYLIHVDLLLLWRAKDILRHRHQICARGHF